MRKDEEEYGRRLIVIGPEGSPLSYIAWTFGTLHVLLTQCWRGTQRPEAS